jgi:hypothetical protein
VHGRDREKEGNQKLECSSHAYYIGASRVANATMGRGLGSSKEVWQR